MKDEEAPFHPHLVHHMAGFQTMKPNKTWDMKGFTKDQPQALTEQELFYRATNYRGS